MHIDIITCQPELLSSPLNESIVKRARDKGVVNIVVHNLRDYSTDKHRKVDDYAYGGGAGMVLMIEPIANCINALKQGKQYDDIIYPTIDVIDLYDGIWIYDNLYECDYKSDEKYKSNMQVEEEFAGFSFNTGILANVLDSYDTSIFNRFGDINLLNVGKKAAFSLKNKDILEAIANRGNLLSGNFADNLFIRLKDKITKSFFVEGKNPILGSRGSRGGKYNSVAQDITKGKLSPDQFVKIINAQFDSSLTPNTIVELFCSDVESVFHEIPALIASLKKRYSLGVLSNTFFGHWDNFITTGS